MELRLCLILGIKFTRIFHSEVFGWSVLAVITSCNFFSQTCGDITNLGSVTGHLTPMFNFPNLANIKQGSKVSKRRYLRLG